MERVERNRELVRVRLAIAANQAGAHTLVSLIVVHAGTDVERIGVEEESNLRSLRCRPALIGLGLEEVGGCGRRRPVRFIQTPVQVDRPVARRRFHLGRRRPVPRRLRPPGWRATDEWDEREDSARHVCPRGKTGLVHVVSGE